MMLFLGGVMKICSVLLFTALATVSAFGQNNLKSVIPAYKPDAPLSYRVEFDDDPAFTAVSIVFNTSANIPDDQPGLTNGFGLDHFVKVKAGVYTIEGKIPNNVVTGDYQLVVVNTTMPPASKQYDAKSQNIRIHIDNDTKYNFPPLKSIKPN
jgi:hypothetical protein